jgi:hypothetical protein
MLDEDLPDLIDHIVVESFDGLEQLVKLEAPRR